MRGQEKRKEEKEGERKKKAKITITKPLLLIWSDEVSIFTFLR